MTYRRRDSKHGKRHHWREERILHNMEIKRITTTNPTPQPQRTQSPTDNGLVKLREAVMRPDFPFAFDPNMSNEQMATYLWSLGANPATSAQYVAWRKELRQRESTAA